MATSSMGTALPRRELVSTVMRTFARASAKPSRNRLSSEAREDRYRDRADLAQASNAITASGTRGRNKPIASPSAIPNRSRAFESRQVSACKPA